MAAQDIQIIPAAIGGERGDYCLLNVLTQRKCIDEARSKFDKRGPATSRPDKSGEFRTMYRLRIDPHWAAPADIFRLLGRQGPVIISERIRNVLEDIEAKGVTFEDVVG